MRFYFCNDITFHSFNIFQDLFSLFFLNIFFFLQLYFFFSGTQQTHYWWKRPNKPLVFSVPLKSCSFTDSATFFIYIFTFWRQKYSHSCFPTHPTQKKKKLSDNCWLWCKHICVKSVWSVFMNKGICDPEPVHHLHGQRFMIFHWGDSLKCPLSVSFYSVP